MREEEEETKRTGSGDDSTTSSVDLVDGLSRERRQDCDRERKGQSRLTMA